jgi:hypothetical protein
LPHCSAPGLRKAFLRRMAEAISGHRDYREIRTYVQAANKAKMASEGMTLPRLKPKSETIKGRTKIANSQVRKYH